MSSVAQSFELDLAKDVLCAEFGDVVADVGWTLLAYGTIEGLSLQELMSFLRDVTHSMDADDDSKAPSLDDVKAALLLLMQHNVVRVAPKSLHHQQLEANSLSKTGGGKNEEQIRRGTSGVAAKTTSTAEISTAPAGNTGSALAGTTGTGGTQVSAQAQREQATHRTLLVTRYVAEVDFVLWRPRFPVYITATKRWFNCSEACSLILRQVLMRGRADVEMLVEDLVRRTNVHTARVDQARKLLLRSGPQDFSNMLLSTDGGGSSSSTGSYNRKRSSSSKSAGGTHSYVKLPFGAKRRRGSSSSSSDPFSVLQQAHQGEEDEDEEELLHVDQFLLALKTLEHHGWITAKVPMRGAGCYQAVSMFDAAKDGQFQASRLELQAHSTRLLDLLLPGGENGEQDEPFSSTKGRDKGKKAKGVGLASASHGLENHPEEQQRLVELVRVLGSTVYSPNLAFLNHVLLRDTVWSALGPKLFPAPRTSKSFQGAQLQIQNGVAGAASTANNHAQEEHICVPTADRACDVVFKELANATGVSRIENNGSYVSAITTVFVTRSALVAKLSNVLPSHDVQQAISRLVEHGTGLVVRTTDQAGGLSADPGRAKPKARGRKKAARSDELSETSAPTDQVNLFGGEAQEVFRVDWSRARELVHLDLTRRLVQWNYSSIAFRVWNFLIEEPIRYHSEQQLEETCLCTQARVRQAVHELFKDGILLVQEIPKGAHSVASGPPPSAFAGATSTYGRGLWLYSIDKMRSALQFKKLIVQAIRNLSKRLEIERQQLSECVNSRRTSGGEAGAGGTSTITGAGGSFLGMFAGGLPSASMGRTEVLPSMPLHDPRVELVNADAFTREEATAVLESRYRSLQTMYQLLREM
ncbi:unnamed protein product [Amoebophrya sp. A25]|nr:unnamed protein product [Amoebophrya sp. A25]|eukprot:GSA25T00000538001.1